jgi:hypothetical protein
MEFFTLENGQSSFMPTATPVERLLQEIKQLPPEQLAEFTVRLAEWQEGEGEGIPDSVLLRQAKSRMSTADAKRLRVLARRSEQERLAPAEVAEYQQLARRAECINAARVRALAELARRRNQAVSKVKQEIGWREDRHGA